MEKKEQILLIEPPYELTFRGPFNVPVSSKLRLTNPTDKSVLFKIKTTAPKKYCVRPNCGLLEAYESTGVIIVLQPFVFDPNEKNKHKFMVQSLVLADGVEVEQVPSQIEQAWKDINPENLMDTKLRCVFQLPADNSVKATTAAKQTAAPSGAADTTNETVKTGAVGDKKTSDVSNDMALADEVKKLREEESQLRQENFKLTEECLRLKISLDALKKSINSSSALPSFENTYSPPMANQQIPFIYIIAGIVLAIFGLIFGKFVL